MDFKLSLRSITTVDKHLFTTAVKMLPLKYLILSLSIALSLAAPPGLKLPSDRSGFLPCTHNPHVCPSNTICAGFRWYKLCVYPRGENHRCGGSFHVCAHGLTCVRYTCKRSSIPRGGRCEAGGTPCASGTECLGPHGNQRCFEKMGLGKQCEVDPWWVCEDGLACVDNVCTNPIIPRGGKCPAAGSKCIAGTECLGPRGNQRCFEKMGLGKQCEVDPWWVCEDGLACVDNVCTNPIIPRGGKCPSARSKCIAGTECVGPAGKQRCFEKMGLGKRCQVDPWWVCQDDLVCVSHRCVRKH